MSPPELDRWREIERLLDHTLELTAAERPAFLDRECVGDTELRAEVERLLQAAQSSDSFLHEPAAVYAAPIVARVITNQGITPETRLGAYEILGQLGRGGMATVYLARDLKHDRAVALKVLHPEFAAALGPERFLREIQLTARLDHPHILPIFDSGETNGLLWYTMPYVEGESLRDRLHREGQLPIDPALTIAREVADALDYAHRHGIVHRDIKPENILLAEGHARVADFGVARALETASGGRLTETGLAVGTPAYMSPEQASAGPVDARSDVYALGCVVYEMLAGEPPYTGPTPQAVIAKRLSEPVPHLRMLRDGVSVAVERAITKALAKAPADRFATAAQLKESLSPVEKAGLTARLPRWSPPRVVRFALSVAMLGLVAVTGVVLRARTGQHADLLQSAASGSGVRSVAVLPLVNVGGDASQEYFSDGMTDELASALAKVPGLRVAARTSAFAFKGRNADIREIGHALNVGTVLEGSVRRAGQRLRVTAQLINVADGYHLWADEYDRELRDAFQVQDELARAIVAALRVPLRLTSRSDTALVKVGTGDLAAHDLYLQGRSFWNQRTPSTLETALRYFERAIARDSTYAEAYAGLAETYVLLPDYTAAPPAEAYPKGKVAALRALAMDSTLGQAHAALGYARMLFDWDWRGAEQEFRRAIALSPSYPTAHQWYAVYLNALGRHGQALAEIERARSLDPLSRIISTIEGVMLYQSRRYDEAIAQLRRTLELDPDFMPAHHWLGRAYLAKGRHSEGVSEMEIEARLIGGRAGVGPFVAAAGALAYAYAGAGQRDRARMLVRQLVARSRRDYVSAYELGLGYTGLGDTDQAVAWLERMADAREPGVADLRVEPLFDSLRSDPRFTRLLKRVGLQ